MKSTEKSQGKDTEDVDHRNKNEFVSRSQNKPKLLIYRLY